MLLRGSQAFRRSTPGGRSGLKPGVGWKTAKRFPPVASGVPGRLVDKAAPLSTLLALIQERSSLEPMRECKFDQIIYINGEHSGPKSGMVELQSRATFNSG
jgi:hypothetical protein